MATYLVFDGAKVINVVECSDASLAETNNWVLDSYGAKIGDSVVNGVLEPLEVEDTDVPVDVEYSYGELRQQRQAMLAATDWTQLPDSPLSDDVKAAYASYRQALRDFMAAYDSEADIYPVVNPVWPELDLPA
jgi:hypothetical protein